MYIIMENGFSKIRNNKENITVKKIKIPEWEMNFSAARSSGPGGQNVNKTSTKVVIRFSIDESKSLSAEQKMKLKERLSNVINKEGEIIVSEQGSRSQFTNRSNAAKKLNDMINMALTEERERFATKPREGSKERRISEKKARSNVKKMRGRVNDY